MIVGLLGSGVALAPAVRHALAGEPSAATSDADHAKRADRRSFQLEILARDASPIAPRAPGEAGRFAIYVRNGGDGFAPTDEEQGLAAMALAEIVRRNEANVSAEGFLTHEGRFAQHRRSLVKKGPTGRRGA
jgi:hypothetical protein